MATTTPARQAEADRVELVYYWAISQIGDDALLDSLELWKQVPATSAAQNAAGWLRAAVQLIKKQRVEAVNLAIAYYRLVRALRTGATIRDQQAGDGKSITLEELRQQFERAVDQIDPAVPTEPATPRTNSSSAEPSPTEQRDELLGDLSDAQDAASDDDQILLDEIAQLDDLIEQQEKEAEQQAAELLDQLGIENMLDKLEQLDTEDTAANVDQGRAEIHDLAGKRQAATAARITMNAARGLAYSLAEYDGKAIGWARFSTTGTPCGFCAMLLARQFVYKNGKTAGSSIDADGNEVEESDKYHDNCRCVAVPIFLEDQKGSDLFALNRQYTELWNEHIKDKYSGDEAISAWRKLLREQAKAAESAPTTQPIQAVG